jgi:hypothetical protein
MLTFTLPGWSGVCTCHNRDLQCTHAPDPDAMSRVKPATLISAVDGERILKEFSSLYSGIAHGIVSVKLDKDEEGKPRILAYVSDWNGTVNIPTSFQGLAVSFTQYVPPGAIFQV